MKTESEQQYSAPRYYEIAFDMNRRQEVNFLVHCFRRYARRKVRTVLDIACGTGPHLIRLAERGYAMSGLDLSPQNIAFLRERAAAKGFEPRLLVADQGVRESVVRPRLAARLPEQTRAQRFVDGVQQRLAGAGGRRQQVK